MLDMIEHWQENSLVWGFIVLQYLNSMPQTHNMAFLCIILYRQARDNIKHFGATKTTSNANASISLVETSPRLPRLISHSDSGDL